MGWGFKKSKKILPGITLRVGKRSAGIRIGSRNAGLSLGTRGTRASASIPGTGLSFSQQLSSGTKQAGAPAVSRPMTEVAKPISGTLVEYALSTPVRLSAKFKTPLGSQISVVSAIADIDYRIHPDGSIELKAARLSKCSPNMAATNTGEAWKASSVTPAKALLESALQDLQMENSTLARFIRGDASSDKSVGILAKGWAGIVLLTTSTAALILIVCGIVAACFSYWIAAVICAVIGLLIARMAWKSLRVFV